MSMYTSKAILAVSVLLVVNDAFRQKSSKMVQEEASSVEAERAQTLKDLQSLAHNVVAGEEKIYDSTREMIKKVETVISQAANEVGPQYDEHQAELDDAKKRFDECTVAYEEKAEEIRSNEGKRTGELGDIHNNSRSAEQQALDEKGKACGTFQDYNTGLSPPSCAPEFPSLCEWGSRSSCIDNLADWSIKHLATYKTLKEPCEAAMQKHADANKFAKDSQLKLEWMLSTWGIKLTDACDHYEDSCWKNALENRKEVHGRISEISEPALKAEFKAVEKIKCYLHVLKVEEKDMPAELKKCDELVLDTTHLNNMYHDIPTQLECETVPAPCDEPWKQKQYVSQHWYDFTAGKQFCKAFPSGAEKVEPTECLEEPQPIGKITKGPTPTSVPKASKYEKQVGQHCGWGGDCNSDNDLHIGSNGERWDSATRITAESVCGTKCSASADCGGFTYVESGNWGQKCYYRKVATCNTQADSNRDCYVKETSDDAGIPTNPGHHTVE